MSKRTALAIPFKELSLKDVPLVGGKNAALGEMLGALVKRGVNVPDGFATTAHAYRIFLKRAKLDREIPHILEGLDTKNLADLARRGRAVREAILAAELPVELVRAIRDGYRKLERKYGGETDVAVRSSATAEDLPGASFAGQQETYLNIRGAERIAEATKKCIASLFTDRAISYRVDKKFSHFDAALSVGIQKMVRSDLASSGVIFTIDTETGFEDAVIVTGSWGLGEMVVQGKVVPDEFTVWKPGLARNLRAVIGRNLGGKNVKLVYASSKSRGMGGTRTVPVSSRDRERFCLTETETLTLARWAVTIEEHFSKLHKRKQPMDIEWAKDGKTKELFIVQARPETVRSLEGKRVYREYRMEGKGKLLTKGIAVGTKIGAGKARVLASAKKITAFKPGEVLVTSITDPDWEPIMKIASAIVTDKGGRTSHAAIVSRELGIPCVVGTENATSTLKTGQMVTVDCSSGDEGRVYAGKIPFAVKEHHLARIRKPKVNVAVNIGTPDEAFKYHYLPVHGVGLGRLEFIIASHIGIHPLALLEYPKLAREAKRDPVVRKLVAKIAAATPGYRNKSEFYVDELAEGVAKIAAAFWPHEVIIRFSDFKTNEYRALTGGDRYEPAEENPMLGWRGASRYYHPAFERAFGLEVKALRRVREKFGLTNVVPMVPFCRTPEEGRRVLAAMAKYGLKRGKTTPRLGKSRDDINPLKIYVMCEIPSNVLRAGEFLDIFDGMSIGSNDLTQLILGLDRDAGALAHIGNEKDGAVKKMIAEIIAECRKRKKYIGICGQAPSDYPDFAIFLAKQKIGSISLNPDAVMPFLMRK
ncbi:MAG: phosphoenolpyruvate synthase [Candidatus Brennerbacteria bacterium]|nr:phosphoenolpyruvate synthase [Candidatus Brennerbacteria bacterium]